MAKFRRKNIIAFITLTLLFLYLYSCMTGYFIHAMDEEVQLNSILIAGLVFFFLLSFFANRSKIIKDRVISAWKTVLIGMMIVAYLLSLFYRFPSTTYYLILALPLLLLLFINSSLEDFNKNFWIAVFGAMMVLLGVSYGILYTQSLFLLYQDTMVTNAGYMVLLFMPLVLCIEKKVFKYVAIILVAVIMLSSNKRGGVVAFVLSIVIYVFVQNRVNINKRFRLLSLVLTLAIIAASLYYLFIYSSNVTDGFLLNRFETIEDDEGSGRLSVYTRTWRMIRSSDFASIIIGHGWNGVLRNSQSHLSAHNDLLEVFYDYGIVVLGLYIMLIVRMFKRLFKMMKQKSKYAANYACALTMFVVLSTVSHIIIYESNLMIVLIVFSCIIHFDKINSYENRNFGISISH